MVGWKTLQRSKQNMNLIRLRYQRIDRSGRRGCDIIIISERALKISDYFCLEIEKAVNLAMVFPDGISDIPVYF